MIFYEFLIKTLRQKILVFCIMRLSLTLMTQITIMDAQEDKDPCQKVVCKWGEMCQLDTFGLAQCKCPSSCPVANQTVCTVYGLEFPSRCEMHRYSCSNSVRISIRNQDRCRSEDIPSNKACPTLDELIQFGDRYLEWLHVAKASTDDFSFKLDQRITHFSINNKINIAKWEFERCDINTNQQLQGREIDLMLNNMKYEPCGFGFIKSCDLDGLNGITQEEWIMCLNLAERPLKKLL